MSINVKALGAFKKLGAVALITATLAMFFTACNQTGGGGGKPTPTPKHAITFSVEGTNGTLKAKADGVPETSTSPINVEEGKEITFTAKANDGYRVKGWTLDGKPITEAGTNTEYKLKVSKPATVSVSFTKKTYAVNFSVAGTGGTLKAEGDGITQPATSPITVEHGKEVIFTAEADAGYKIGKWTVTGSVLEAGTGADGSETAKVKITADTTVSVSFELLPAGTAILTLNPNYLIIRWFNAKTADGSDIAVEGCTETTLKSNEETTLHATGTTVILKGKITELSVGSSENNKGSLTALNVQGLTSLKELWCGNGQLTTINAQGCASLQLLSCWNNQLTSLNVSGCTSLKKLKCLSNKLNAQAMTALLNALPAREVGDNAWALLYTEETDIPEGNHKDFTQSEDLKKAFDGAKKRNWTLQKEDADGHRVDI